MIKLKNLLSESSLLQEKVVYHGTISDFVDAINKSGYLLSPKGGAKKVSGGWTTEMGLIWVTPEFNVANVYAHGIEVLPEKGLKADYGGVFELEIDDNLRLLDRYAPLSQEELYIINRRFIPDYKPLKTGDSILTAERRMFNKYGLHDMLLALGYDGVIYDKKQIGIARDTLPIKAFHKHKKS